MQEDLATMAQYMQQEFKTAFRNDPYRRFQVVDVPQKGSLTLELALTELVPSNVALSVLEYAPMAAAPRSGLWKEPRAPRARWPSRPG